MPRIAYTTREAVAAALDVRLTPRINQVIDRAVLSASGSIEGLCHRVFYPTVDTRQIERTRQAVPTSSRLWLPHGWELISLTSLSAGGVAIPVGDVDLHPTDGPPYNRIEIKPSSSASFYAGDADEGIDVVGLWGYRDDETAVGTTVEALDASETAVDVSDSSAVGVGGLIRIDSERMTVTGKTMLDTGQNLAGALDADVTAEIVPVGDGTAFTAGETILVGSERMLIDDIAGNSLIVTRGVDSTTISGHSSGADVYAPRTLTVIRGVLGTTAATHTSGSTVRRHDYPALVQELADEESITSVLEKVTGIARVVGEYSSRLGRSDTVTTGYGQVTDKKGAQTGRGLDAIRADVLAAHGRKARHSAV